MDPEPSKLVIPSSSLLDDLGRVHRVKAKPLRGRFASLDTAATAKDWQLRGRGAVQEPRQANLRPETER